LLPRDISGEDRMASLQRDLMRAGQYIPGLSLEDRDDLAQQARVNASSKYCLDALPDNGPALTLERAYAQMLPLLAGTVPRFSFVVDVAAATTLKVELRASERIGNYTPNVPLDQREFDLQPGANQTISADFGTVLDAAQYIFVCVLANEAVTLHLSQQRVTGLLALQHRRTQEPPPDIGVDTFEMWTPPRRPAGHNIAMTFEPPINGFDPDNVTNGQMRPTMTVNVWVAALDDARPTLDLIWDEARSIRKIVLAFDSDYDHAMETTLMGHPENVTPFTVKHYRITDSEGQVVFECADNHQTINQIALDEPLVTDRLSIELLSSHDGTPLALYAVHCYE
jgi:hypothetical protein